MGKRREGERNVVLSPLFSSGFHAFLLLFAHYPSELSFGIRKRTLSLFCHLITLSLLSLVNLISINTASWYNMTRTQAFNSSCATHTWMTQARLVSLLVFQSLHL